MDLIQNFDTPGRFFDKNLATLEDNYYENFYFLNMRENLIEQKFKALDCFNVSDGNHLIMCLCTEAGICISASGFTLPMLDQLYQRITRIRYTNIQFYGNRDLLLTLFDRFQVAYEIYKDRIIYKTDSVLKLKKTHLGKGVNSNMEDYEELVSLCYDYSLEEWGERKGRGIDYFQAVVVGWIQQQCLIQYDVMGGIGCIAQVLNLEEGMPIIGSLFTPQKFREKGYATMLVHAITKNLLNSGFPEVGIISDASNPYTNKMFTNIGFKPVQTHLQISCKNFFRTN